MKKDTEKTILATAQKHFVQKGFAATRLQEIADDANINKAMLHYYFRSKDKLYQEVLSHTLGSLLPNLSNALSGGGSFIERTERIVGTYIDTIVKSPEIPLFMMMELTQNKEGFIEAYRKHADLFPAIQSYIGQMMKEMEEQKIKQIPPIHLILNVFGMTLFPFIAKPMIRTILGVDDEAFGVLIKERKRIVMDFIRSGVEIK